MSETRPCRFCRAPIEYILGPNGKHIPAQKVTQLFLLRDGRLVRAPSVVTPEMTSSAEAVYVNHFQTCPDADKASKRRKAE